MKIKIKKYRYKLKCVFCGKEVIRKTYLRKAVCDKCKYRYKKKSAKIKKARNDVIFYLRKDGFSCRKIGSIFGISRQRVGQILKTYKKEK